MGRHIIVAFAALVGLSACAGMSGMTMAERQPDLVLSQRSVNVMERYINERGAPGALAVSQDGRVAGFSYCTESIRSRCTNRGLRETAQEVCKRQGGGSCVDVMMGSQIVYNGAVQAGDRSFDYGEWVRRL